MLEFFRKRMRDDRGFTLIELMVVVLIIAILIAIAIPTFLGLRERAQDRAAQSNLRNGLVAAKAFFTDDETYTGFDKADGEAIEPSLNWADSGDPDGEGIVTISAASTNTGRLVTMSASETWFCIQDVGGVNGYGTGDTRLLAEGACGATSW